MLQNEKDKNTTIERTNETEPKKYSGRADYYPFNQNFLDEYYKMCEARRLKG